jgi:aryl-alcohol dehydrogenase-like predicted oxidoreductase
MYKRHGISMAQVSLAWSLALARVTAPVIGSTSMKNLEELIRARHRSPCGIMMVV